MSGHTLYTPADFTNEEIERRNTPAVMVCEGGLGVCKYCGAGEIELEQWPTCAEYKAAKRAEHMAQKEMQLTACIINRDVPEG